MNMARLLLVLAVGLVAACTKPVVVAPMEVVQAARYSHPGPTEIYLFNVISKDTGRGEHAALIINADQRVLFDPAGSWTHPNAPERNDVHYGFTESVMRHYLTYHGSERYTIRLQRLAVTPQQAQQILYLAERAGPVPDAQCARSIGTILRQVDGFESVPITWFPNALSDGFARLPGVSEEIIDLNLQPTTGPVAAAAAVPAG